MRILALNAFHGGSHRAFLDGWQRHSAHEFTTLTLPAYKWKWRMRHSAVTFARMLNEQCPPCRSQCWDALFCTDMLNLAEFRGLCPDIVRQLPAVVYFHENQLTYPVSKPRERDLHFAMTNLTSALSADEVWFNSAFHRDEFLGALADLLQRMPDFQCPQAVEEIRRKSRIEYPGIALIDSCRERQPGPLRIVWVSRWEHDKNPELFFAALKELRRRDCPFHVNVLGESFESSPACFAEGRADLHDRILNWGFVGSRKEYESILAQSDVVVSTATHEFFGIAVLEAVSAGCHPLVPKALAYPETLGSEGSSFHDGTVNGLADRLQELCGAADEALFGRAGRIDSGRFCWTARAPALDDRLQAVVEAGCS